jgi:hypothetical protein
VVHDAKTNGFGKTVEFSHYGHNGIQDGPIGNELVATSDGNATQLPFDEWAKIDFNFHPTRSFAVFYGCNSYAFAERFWTAQPVTYAGGYAVPSFPSQARTERDIPLFGDAQGWSSTSTYFVGAKGGKANFLAGWAWSGESSELKLVSPTGTANAYPNVGVERNPFFE